MLVRKIVRKAAAGVGAAAFAVSTLTVATVATAGPAAADTPGCVSDREWRKVRPGWSMERVHRVFDTRGRLSSISSGGGTRDVYRDYRACRRPDNTYMTINFDNYSHRRQGPGMRVYNKDLSRYWY